MSAIRIAGLIAAGILWGCGGNDSLSQDSQEEGQSTAHLMPCESCIYLFDECKIQAAGNPTDLALCSAQFRQCTATCT
ncbi:hypothetical protein [Myxococcus sp. CA039A]|uniref:hypothetical protein n=1 Tax=Myxococcus sp. CA039A TaxID=2741737 RepID=UPI00157B83A2|nr:hypothetical protein [Myxococcus sp. CA039A]NTX53672.1 hypothetical protein [Myxococcus sp. CA039A]